MTSFNIKYLFESSGGTSGKEPVGSTPGLGKSPGEGNNYPLQYSGPENYMERGAWQVQSMGTRLSDFHFTYIS